jgi:hypothetical protein
MLLSLPKRRRRDLINDHPNRAAAAEAPLDAAQERHHFGSPTNHTRGAYHHSDRKFALP